MAQKMTGALVFDERTDRYDMGRTNAVRPCFSVGGECR